MLVCNLSFAVIIPHRIASSPYLSPLLMIVNVERAKREFPPLQIRVIDVISSFDPSLEDADSMALKISSTWIRKYLQEQEHGKQEVEAGDK